MKWLTAVVSVLVIASSLPASAHKTGLATKTCPLSGVEFKATVEMSGTRFCTRYDLKAVGPIGSPPAVPVCPDHGLVLYREFTEAEVASLRTWVTTPSFQSLAPTAPWWRAAETMKHLHEDPADIAWGYLMASWQVELDDVQYRRALGEAAEVLHAFVSTHAEPTSEQARNSLLLLVEVRRLRGDFQLAQKCLDTLRARSVGQALSPTVQQLLTDEQTFITKQDRTQHYLGADEEGCRAADRSQQHAQQRSLQGAGDH